MYSMHNSGLWSGIFNATEKTTPCKTTRFTRIQAALMGVACMFSTVAVFVPTMPSIITTQAVQEALFLPTIVVIRLQVTPSTTTQLGMAGAFISSFSTTDLKNNLFWANTQLGANNVAGADIGQVTSTVSVSYCLTQENSLYSSGLGIINNVNPLFVNTTDLDGADDLAGTADDGLTLSPCSPLINMGIMQA